MLVSTHVFRLLIRACNPDGMLNTPTSSLGFQGHVWPGNMTTQRDRTLWSLSQSPVSIYDC